jgi:hypothetical protein
MVLSLTSIVLDLQQNFRKDMQKLDFSPKLYFEVLLFKFNAWLFNYAMCNIGFRENEA